MVKLVYCISKKPNLTDEEFFRYWKDVHGPIGARIPEPAFDGMVELWFDSAEALLAARQSTEWKASSDDEANFIDSARVAYLVTEEHVVVAQK